MILRIFFSKKFRFIIKLSMEYFPQVFLVLIDLQT